MRIPKINMLNLITLMIYLLLANSSAAIENHKVLTFIDTVYCESSFKSMNSMIDTICKAEYSELQLNSNSYFYKGLSATIENLTNYYPLKDRNNLIEIWSMRIIPVDSTRFVLIGIPESTLGSLMSVYNSISRNRLFEGILTHKNSNSKILSCIFFRLMNNFEEEKLLRQILTIDSKKTLSLNFKLILKDLKIKVFDSLEEDFIYGWLITFDSSELIYLNNPHSRQNCLDRRIEFQLLNVR